MKNRVVLISFGSRYSLFIVIQSLHCRLEKWNIWSNIATHYKGKFWLLKSAFQTTDEINIKILKWVYVVGSRRYCMNTARCWNSTLYLDTLFTLLMIFVLNRDHWHNHGLHRITTPYMVLWSQSCHIWIFHWIYLIMWYAKTKL